MSKWRLRLTCNPDGLWSTEVSYDAGLIRVFSSRTSAGLAADVLDFICGKDTKPLIIVSGEGSIDLGDAAQARRVNCLIRVNHKGRSKKL